MKHLALLGDWADVSPLAEHLRTSGFTVTLLPDLPRQRDPHQGLAGAHSAPSLGLVAARHVDRLYELAAVAEGQGLPWLFLCGSTTEQAVEITTAAYEAGALAVLPAGASAELVAQAAERAGRSLSLDTPEPVGPRRLHYRGGDPINLRPDEMMRIVDGVVAQIVWREDGSEGLVGLWGPGHLLCGHPEDACCLELRAQTDIRADVAPLSSEGDAFEKLLERTRRLEAWSSVQSRHSMQQRLSGVLGLLAEQFGTPCSEGTRIDVRMTHAQLASAIGATRATVTRLLGSLRREDLLRTVTFDGGERYCLPKGFCLHETPAFSEGTSADPGPDERADHHSVGGGAGGPEASRHPASLHPSTGSNVFLMGSR